MAVDRHELLEGEALRLVPVATTLPFEPETRGPRELLGPHPVGQAPHLQEVASASRDAAEDQQAGLLGLHQRAEGSDRAREVLPERAVAEIPHVPLAEAAE